MRKTVLTAALALLAGCSQVILGDGGATLEFTAREEGTGAYHPQPQLTATAGDGEIVVDALLSAPDACRKLTATHTLDGAVATIDVRIERDAPVCAAAIANFSYTARLRGLSAGVYQLRVRHAYPGTGWPNPGTVLDVDLNVR